MAADELRIRDATTADHAAFTRLFAELGVDEAPMSEEQFRSEMMATTLIAERGRSSDVVGYAYFRPLRDTVHLSQLVTAPGSRRSGVGRLLFDEVSRRSRAVGCSRLKLNVRLGNDAAIALYESVGLETRFVSRGMRLAWSVLDAVSEDAAPFANRVREIDPAEDERLENMVRLVEGTLSFQRTRVGRAFRMIETDHGVAVGVFDPTFRGLYPFRATDGAHALSLLRGFRDCAAPDDPVVNMMIEDQIAMSDELLRVGATLRLKTFTMFGPLSG